ncbi:MAG: multidrug transporter [Longicatena sp.]
MKKMAIVLCAWFMLVSVLMTCNARSEIEYQINYDTKTVQTYEAKSKIQEIYSELVSGVHSQSYILMVLHNLDKFEYKKNVKAQWKDNRLLIIEGNGKGDHIRGTLQSVSVCVAQVEPRSLLKELFE